MGSPGYLAKITCFLTRNEPDAAQLSAGRDAIVPIHSWRHVSPVRPGWLRTSATQVNDGILHEPSSTVDGTLQSHPELVVTTVLHHDTQALGTIGP